MTRVVALGKPSNRDESSWYFQRYVPHLPVGGEIGAVQPQLVQPRRRRIRHWDKYSEARDEIFARTHSAFAPWHVVRTDDRRTARVQVVAACVAFMIGLFVLFSVKVAAPWDRAVLLRLGQFRALRGPGMFLMVPVIDTVAYWLDTRVITTGFKAEKTLTKDTVPVDVDAVLFWKVIDPQKAALAVADYTSAISWASQTALRDIIGKTMLADMLEGRDKISTQLQTIIDQRTEPWGVNVISVEVRDVLIPPSLENAMSMQAQAERERQARVILGDSERQVAEKFGEAAKTYAHDPIALHLRAMNMLYEGLKQNSTIVIVPSSAVESMQLGGLAGLTALTMGLEKNKNGASKPAEAIASKPAEPVASNSETVGDGVNVSASVIA